MKHEFLLKSTALRVVLWILLGASIVLLLKVLTYQTYPDFNTYYYGAKLALGGGNPYIGVQKDGFTFLYPPPAIPFLLPLTILPLFWAGKAFTFVSLVCLVSAVMTLYRVVRIKASSVLGLIIGILVCNLFPAKFTLGMGQINNVILLLVALFMFFYVRQRSYLAGIALGVALAIKLTPALLIIYLLIERRWKVLFVVALTVALLALVSLLSVSPPTDLYFLHTALPNLTNSWKGDYYNQALSGWLMRDMASSAIRDVLRTLLAAVLFLAAFGTIWRARHNGPNPLLAISLIITLGLIVNTFSWQHHFVWLLVPMIVLSAAIRKAHLNWRYYLLLAFSYLLVAINLKNPGAVPVLLQSHVLYGALLLYGLNLYLLATNKLTKF